MTSEPLEPHATLSELAREVSGVIVRGTPSLTVRDVHHDARHVVKGDVYVARKGQHRDGSAFVPQAIERGAAAVIAEQELPFDIAQIVVKDAHRALAFASSTVWRHPSFSLEVLGVTGTNGKTTTTWLLEHILERSGQPTGLLGTVEHRFRTHRWPAMHTTPEADDLARRMAAMRAAGADNVAMEVSSHALALGRCEAVRFRIAGFSNLTQDHLDFHRSIEEYAQSKYRLFSELGPAISVLNIDDATGAKWAASALKSQILTYSARGLSKADFSATSASLTASGIIAEVRTPVGNVTVRSPLVGMHNLENLLLAMAMAFAREASMTDIVQALTDAVGAPGRLDRVIVEGEPEIPAVFVDYAHSPDALTNVLRALAAVRGESEPRRRIICIFGCGGDRDATKRPLMGAAAVAGSDVTIVTTDNPRTEPVERIAEQAVAGIDQKQYQLLSIAEIAANPEATGVFAVVLDRRAAIAAAIAQARPQDIVLIAGKGHEAYQEIHGVRHPFDDRVEAKAALVQWCATRKRRT